jgi:hypothetical protein
LTSVRRRRASWKVTGRTIAPRNAERHLLSIIQTHLSPSVLPRRETNERLTLLSAPSTSRPHLLQLRYRLLASQANVAVGSKAEKLNASLCFPLCSRERTSLMHSACQFRVESRCDAVALASNISVSAPFVWRCLTGSTMAPFSHSAHRTGQADFPHPALGQNFTPSPTASRAQACSGVRAQSARKDAGVDRSRPCDAWFCA